jgi:superfamily I DNA and/or RNA helicase
LHQASFYLPSLFLSYHYRSCHPKLISFSNKYFYQNRLSTFRDASFNDKPIQFKFIPKGRFDERTNIIEAKAVVDYICSRLSTTDTLGIVAFSESQLQLIFDLLPISSKEILLDKIDLNQVFFKAVENVQGDECDELIVSFGYGYSEKERVFAYRFGPINLNSGAKRLNVLFTRARRKITFFASVTYDDFKPSSNESVEILRKWFRTLTEIEQDTNDFQCKIHVKDILSKNQNIHTIKSLVSIYKERNWILEVR